MARPAVDFDAPDLAHRIEQLSQSDIDALSFGVMRLARDGTVTFYSETEAKQSGYDGSPVGQNLYVICQRFAGDGFRGRINRAMEQGAVDLEFGWTGDYSDPKRDLRIRVQSASGDGVWVFVERDSA
jgi:photoactive yellow protein